ncbi:MAG TPA: pilus assembly protein PilY, partial [Myxococcaceae bacterium]|nr:pilus assembly protein PilY [Myxococcaceae bacterium]
RTVVVVGSGTGGVHRFALDMTELLPDTASGRAGRPPSERGDFLWMWPQPCEPLALQLGESDGHFTPRPPPIGPVAMEDPDGPWEVGGQKAREQWVAFLNGGYDSTLSRGRGLAMVDLATGETLWSFFHGDGSARSEHLRYPFAASVAMMDLGNARTSKPEGDLLFDTATVADYGGQVWTVRFWQPGRRPVGGGPVENWFAARSFRVEAAGEDAVRPSFSYMTSNALQADTGFVRTYLGTGDRYNLADSGGTTCRLSNPLGCAQLGCRVSQSITVERGGQTAWSASTSHADYAYTGSTPTLGAGGAACSSAKVSLTWDYGADNGCEASSAGGLEYSCDGSGAAWSCRVTRDDWESVSVTKALPATSPHRFYGFWSYGGRPTRTFDTDAEASAFEAGLLTDGDLVDVSQFEAGGRVGAGQQESGALGPGWYLKYGVSREQTGSGAAIVNGCVLWNSFEPAGAGGMCATSDEHSARVYQADFVGGAARCAEGFYTVSTGGGTWKRYEERKVPAVPADPVPQRTMDTVDVVLNEAGGPRRVGVTLEAEVLQSLYQLEVDRSAHDCRHEGVRCE